MSDNKTYFLGSDGLYEQEGDGEIKIVEQDPPYVEIGEPTYIYYDAQSSSWIKEKDDG